ncbi:hypothetical protein CDL12_12956 [Handroanthus impetiginosus]|uniref:Pectinesterase inhibitor domain-containing protein n=1 Tax=Handroanthus impetiginosus TaxID=429701 RepID=A0A2G9HA64_9LAMI|nr:hypothetical protein CDL12_12956 [Handroanthus impetiginosus]
MEPTNNKTFRNDEDVITLLAFRKRNKIIILFFFLLIISITLILGTLISYLIHNDTLQVSQPQINPAVEAFCYVSYNTSSCIRTTNYIINTKSVSDDPNQIFTLSLQTAAKELQNVISFLLTFGSVEPDVIAFENCSRSLHDAMGEIRDILGLMRVNPFVEEQSDEQRVEMMNEVSGAGENIGSCLDYLDKVNGSTATIAKLLQAKEYVNISEDFLIEYAEVLQMFWSDNGDRGLNFEIMFGICMGGILQLLFMFFLFWSLCRIR